MNTKRKPGCEARWASHEPPGPVQGDKLQHVCRERPKGQWVQLCISTHPLLWQTSKYKELGQASKAAKGRNSPHWGSHGLAFHVSHVAIHSYPFFLNHKKPFSSLCKTYFRVWLELENARKYGEGNYNNSLYHYRVLPQLPLSRSGHVTLSDQSDIGRSSALG